MNLNPSRSKASRRSIFVLPFLFFTSLYPFPLQFPPCHSTKQSYNNSLLAIRLGREYRASFGLIVPTYKTVRSTSHAIFYIDTSFFHGPSILSWLQDHTAGLSLLPMEEFVSWNRKLLHKSGEGFPAPTRTGTASRLQIHGALMMGDSDWQILLYYYHYYFSC
jgi:hypothetical protein